MNAMLWKRVELVENFLLVEACNIIMMNYVQMIGACHLCTKERIACYGKTDRFSA